MDISNITVWSTLFVAVVGVLGTIIVASIRAYADYTIKKLEIKEKESKIKTQEQNQKSIQHSINSTSTIIDVLENIKKEINSDRLNIWMFHNGGYYYTGESIQRMTMIIELNNEGFEDVKHKFLNIPIRFFARNLNKLNSSENNYAFERNELAYEDALAQANKEYEVTSSALFKIKSSDNKDWIGMLVIGWLSHKELDEKQISYVQNKIKDISNALTPEYLIN